MLECDDVGKKVDGVDNIMKALRERIVELEEEVTGLW